MTAKAALSALSTIAAWYGTILNQTKPILETELLIDGNRFEGIISPVVRNPMFAIRLRPRKILSLAEYQQSNIPTGKDDPLKKPRTRDDLAASVRGLDHAGIIRAAIAARKNILVVEATCRSKTTLVNAVTSCSTHRTNQFNRTNSPSTLRPQLR